MARSIVGHQRMVGDFLKQCRVRRIRQQVIRVFPGVPLDPERQAFLLSRGQPIPFEALRQRLQIRVFRMAQLVGQNHDPECLGIRIRAEQLQALLADRFPVQRDLVGDGIVFAPNEPSARKPFLDDNACRAARPSQPASDPFLEIPSGQSLHPVFLSQIESIIDSCARNASFRRTISIDGLLPFIPI